MVLSVLALVAAACGGGSAAGPPVHRSPRQAVLASVSSTESASSAAIAISVSVNGTLSLGGSSSGSTGTPISLSVTGQGLYSFGQKTGELALTIPSLGQGSAGTVKIDEIGDELYLSNPRLSSLDGGTPWVEVDLSALQQSQSSNPVGALADSNPTQILSLLQELGASVTEVGTSDIDGVPTTEYQGDLNLTGNSGGSSNSATIISPQLAQLLGLSDIPVDVWVDSAGRARQISTSFTVVGLTVQAQADLSDFGAPVSVAAPPSDEVADGSSLLQGGQLGSLFGTGSALSS